MVRDDDVRSIEGVNEPPCRARPRRTRQVILLVEDNEADHDVYGGLLWYNGYEVLHAVDGATALSRARESCPDLILMDMMLPGGMSGADTSRRLREEGIDAPIVVLSARPEEEAAADLDGLDVAGYLEKPIDPFAVVREVQRRVGFAGTDTNGD